MSFPDDVTKNYYEGPTRLEKLRRYVAGHLRRLKCLLQGKCWICEYWGKRMCGRHGP